ncbi:hypothetical protein TNCV_1119571 [Trichonephila clavipes]|uniref:Uncharacterized protein n=1 Tax=Trichonephila clavipes TaxID=2585209 RepID=A0A8X6VS85_TRICX|nr:hypothetical protein TNCV_1119571 [Trichonephila clavipes]
MLKKRRVSSSQLQPSSPALELVAIVAKLWQDSPCGPKLTVPILVFVTLAPGRAFAHVSVSRRAPGDGHRTSERHSSDEIDTSAGTSYCQSPHEWDPRQIEHALVPLHKSSVAAGHTISKTGPLHYPIRTR